MMPLLFDQELALGNPHHEILEKGNLTSDRAHPLNVGKTREHVFALAGQRRRQ